MCPVPPIFWMISSLTTCCVLSGPLNVHYLCAAHTVLFKIRVVGRCQMGLPLLSQWSVLSPVTSRTNVAVHRVDKYRRALYFATGENFQRFCGVNLKKKRNLFGFTVTSLLRVLGLSTANCVYVPKFMPLPHSPFLCFSESTNLMASCPCRTV